MINEESKNNDFIDANNLVKAYENRAEVIQKITEDTKGLLEGFRQRREMMSQQLKGALAKHESLRKKDFDKMMEAILVAQLRREENVKKMLTDFQEQETMVAKNLKEALLKGEKLRLKDFQKIIGKIRGEQEAHQKEAPEKIREELRQMQSEVSTMLENFKEERKTMTLEWEKMMVMTAGRRDGSEIKIN